MKIGIQAWGSRGDINPYLALGQELSKAGHEVLMYYTCYNGDDFARFSNPNFTIKSSEEFGEQKNIRSTITIKQIYQLSEEEQMTYIMHDVYPRFHHEIIAAAKPLCKQSDLIIASPQLYHISCLAEKHNIPRVCIHLEDFFSPKQNVQNVSDSVNKEYLETINSFRSGLELPPVKNALFEVMNSKILNLLNFSRIFGSEPSHWGDAYKITGFLEVQTDQQEINTDALEQFLRKGDAPVFFSLGSMSFFESDLTKILDIFLEAIELSKCRAIIQAPWDKLNLEFSGSPDRIFKLSYFPHGLVFPRCRAIVHHGGAGTTHSTILYGVPSIVIAYAWDQFAWGNALCRLGMAPSTIKRKSLDSIQLTGSIRKVLVNPEYNEHAIACKRKMKRENGVKKGVKLIEHYMGVLESKKQATVEN